MIEARLIAFVTKVHRVPVYNLYKIVDANDPSQGDLLALICIRKQIAKFNYSQEFVVSDGTKCCRISEDVKKCDVCSQVLSHGCFPYISITKKVYIKWRDSKNKYAMRGGLTRTHESTSVGSRCEAIRLRYNKSFEDHPPYEFAGILMSEEEMDSIRQTIAGGL